MPILSEVEQRHCIGGDVVVVNRNGQFIGNDGGHYAENIEGYAQYANDPNKTIWVVVTERGQYYDSMISSGADSVKNNHHSGQTDKGTDLEGYGITRDVLSFLGENTKVEWMMFEDESGYRRLLSESGEHEYNRTFSKEDFNGRNYTVACHTHPDVYGYDGMPSGKDKANTGAFIDLGFNKCMVYSAKYNSWIVYYGEADKSEDEVYEDDVRK